ncbi:hypothetical protein [Cetobacterium somerae]|uniref:hypothetical protein n=1 Tax=Cetobacterium somerae TaxID=188913 RepID=UPI00248EC70F|nr:hypothetical protein [Cetobacterium somerae]
MVVKFDKKPIQVPYQKMTQYKIFQLIAICKIFKTVKLLKLQIIFYILDNNLSLNVLENDLIYNKFLITSFNPDILKTIDFCFGYNLISFSSNNFKLTEKGEKYYTDILKEKIFTTKIKEIKELKKKNPYIVNYIKKIKE